MRDSDHHLSAGDFGSETSEPSAPRNPSCGNRPTRVRTAFLVCGAVFVAFSVLVVTEGLSNLQSTVAVMQGSTQEVRSISTSAIDILENGFLRAGHVATTVRTELGAQLSNGAFCPRDPSLENTDEGKELRAQAVNALAQLQELGDFMKTNVERMLVPIKRFAAESAYVDERLAPIDFTDWRAMLILIPYSIVPALLMGGTLMALFDASIPAYVCFTNWFLMPIFIVLVVLAWAVASTMLVMAGMNGDFCLPSGYYEGNPPDGTIRNLLNAQGYSNTTAYAIADFYVAQCRKDDPFGFIYDAQPELQNAEMNLLNIGKLLAAPNFLSTLSLYCDRDYSSLTEMVDNMDTLVQLLVDAVTRTIDLIRCDRIVPLYTETIYHGVCTYSPAAVFWVFFSSLFMGLAGMLMITFRSSYKMTDYEYEAQDGGDGVLLHDRDDDGYEDETPRSGTISARPDSQSRWSRDDEYDYDEPPRSGRVSGQPNSQNRWFGSDDEGENDVTNYPSQHHPDYPNKSNNSLYSHDCMHEDELYNDPTYAYERQRNPQSQSSPYYCD
jgi:hypothetical protein